MIHAIVLAAGRSRRMGTQKLLLPVGGRPTIERVVDALPRMVIDRIWVVTNPEGEPVRAALAGRDVCFVTNPDPEADMLSSVRRGLRALPEPWEGTLIAVGDQPALTPGVVQRLVETFRTARRGIVVPAHQRKRAHPILVARRHLEEILTRHDTVGLRGLLHAHPEDVTEVEVDDPGVLEDMDHPEDYARIAGRFGA